MKNLNGFLNMLQSFDPYFPIGSFTMSNGLETYVQNSMISTVNELDEYIENFLYILPYNELAFMYFASQKYDIEELDMIASAVKSPYEVRNGSIKLCTRFIKLQQFMEGSNALKYYAELIDKNICDGHYSLALGLLLVENEIEIDTALSMYAYTILSAIINNAVKMVPLSQMAGQKLLHKHLKTLEKAVGITKKLSIDEIGRSAVGIDLSAMKHEKLFARLYMS